MSWAVKDGFLFKDGQQVVYRPTPNHGGPLAPSLLVMHYTAGNTATSAIEWLCNPAAKASAHLVVAQDGTVVQLVPFNKTAWHAGVSKWKNRTGCNGFSVGIELVNPGFLTRTASGAFLDSGHHTVPPNMVMLAEHKNGGPVLPWMLYQPAQIDAAVGIAQAITEAYGIKEIAGHEDIAPGRKTDPGPAFPMASFVSRVFGRK